MQRICIPDYDDRGKLPCDSEELKDVVMIQASHMRAMLATIEKLQHMIYGPSSEKSHDNPDQQNFLADAQTEAAVAPDTPKPEQPKQPCKGHGRRVLPKDLPRRTVVHGVSEHDAICEQCNTPKVVIGKETSEQLEFVPARLEVIEHVCLIMACPVCQQGVVQGKKPFEAIEKGMAGPGLLAQVIISKYADHLPLNRQEAIFARHGIDLSRTTLCTWAMQCADLLMILYECERKALLNSCVLHTDATGVPVLAPGHTHASHLWAYVGDREHPYTLYHFTWTHNRAGPQQFLGNYKGHLQADAHNVYDGLYTEGKLVELGCWAHARRKFVEAQSTDGVYAREAVERIRALYEIERKAKDMDDLQRRAFRQEHAKPLLEKLFEWINESVIKVRPKSPMGEALAYALKNEKALRRYIEDGRFAIDNNAAERALRLVAVGRKNWMFAGSKRGAQAAAVFYSLIESARRNGLNVFEYLRDVLERLPAHPITRISEFLPDNWKKLHAGSADSQQSPAPISLA